MGVVHIVPLRKNDQLPGFAVLWLMSLRMCLRGIQMRSNLARPPSSDTDSNQSD